MKGLAAATVPHGYELKTFVKKAMTVTAAIVKNDGYQSNKTAFEDTLIASP